MADKLSEFHGHVTDIWMQIGYFALFVDARADDTGQWERRSKYRFITRRALT